MNIDVVWDSGNGRKKLSISPSAGTSTTTTIDGGYITVTSSSSATSSSTKVTFGGPVSTTPTTICTKKVAGKTAIKKPNKTTIKKPTIKKPTIKTTIKRPQEKKPKTQPSISILPSASPPLPPMWSERYTETVSSLATYKLFPVDSKTLEYSTIAELLYPAEILTVEQIINPVLWSRFVRTRKDMLHSKSGDTELLSQLQLTEEELMASYQYSLNFVKDPRVASVPYNDNVALLFHCTRRSENIQNILRQGLDERMACDDGGLLGRGIYFSDNPEKSMTYDGCGGIIFIFAVLLGDCLSVDNMEDKKSYVREPEKLPEEKRTFNDLFFDSIVAKPGMNGDNEYVVYNRYQCCPLYKIEYSLSHQGLTSFDNDCYSIPRQYLPPLCWMPDDNEDIALPQQSPDCDWPFYAKLVFAKMEEKEEQSSEMKEEKDVTEAGLCKDGSERRTI